MLLPFFQARKRCETTRAFSNFVRLVEFREGSYNERISRLLLPPSFPYFFLTSLASHFELHFLTFSTKARGSCTWYKCHFLRIHRMWKICSSKMGSWVRKKQACSLPLWQVCPFFLSFVSVWDWEVVGRAGRGKKQHNGSSSSWVPLPSLPLSQSIHPLIGNK